MIGKVLCLAPKRQAQEETFACPGGRGRQLVALVCLLEPDPQAQAEGPRVKQEGAAEAADQVGV
ncbi:MAG: hypothetical protein ACK44O_10630, partial [Novosphingobium sp.]